MSLNADFLFDRRRLKRRLSFWRGLAIGALVVLVVTGVQLTLGELSSFGARPHVARLNVTGLITEDRRLLDAIDDAVGSDAVEAILVNVDSPGGTVVGGESLYLALRKAAAEKPVVAVMGTTAASAGYMVAIAADTVFARAGTITGSIGVLFQTAEVTELLGKLGIESTTIKSSPLKAVPSPFEELTPEGRAATQSVVDSTYAMFVDMVRERRSLEPEQVAQVADGRIFTGRQALERKLVDAIGGEEDARAWLEAERKVSSELPVFDIGVEEKESWIFGSATALIRKTLLPERLRLDGLLALWHPSLRM